MLHSKKALSAPALNAQKNFYSNLSNSFSDQIVSVTENENGDLVCDARKLHQKLKTKTQFTKWIQRRIQDFGFQEGYDYWSKLTNRLDGKPGKSRNDFELTIDTAKELAMLENNAEGKVVRKYFISVEKAFRKAIEKLYTPINGITPIHKDGKIGYPRKEFLISIKRNYKNGYRLRHQYANDCFNIGSTACISASLAEILATKYVTRQLDLDLRTDKTLAQ